MIFRDNTLFPFIVALLILFCSGMEQENCVVSKTIVTEISIDQNNGNLQPNINPDIFDDDHFSTWSDLSHCVNHPNNLPDTANQPVYSGFTDSGWRPPKFL